MTASHCTPARSRTLHLDQPLLASAVTLSLLSVSTKATLSPTPNFAPHLDFHPHLPSWESPSTRVCRVSVCPLGSGWSSPAIPRDEKIISRNIGTRLETLCYWQASSGEKHCFWLPPNSDPWLASPSCCLDRALSAAGKPLVDFRCSFKHLCQQQIPVTSLD